MTTGTQPMSDALDEALAIIEAEWMRLSRDDGDWDRELAEAITELPARRDAPPRCGTATSTSAQPATQPPTWQATHVPRAAPATDVWPMQRSPPTAKALIETRWSATEVVP